MTDQNYKLVPVERDESCDRTYIPLPGGWEVQTKGKGSTFRICDPSGSRLPIPDSPYLHETLERMAREIHTAVAAAPECKEPPVAWWNGMQETPLGGMPPSIQWGADAEDTRHDIPLYAGFNPVYTHPVAPEPVCKWASDDDGNWWGSCGQGYTFIDGGPKENNWNFCNYCGKKVEVVE